MMMIMVLIHHSTKKNGSHLLIIFISLCFIITNITTVSLEAVLLATIIDDVRNFAIFTLPFLSAE